MMWILEVSVPVCRQIGYWTLGKSRRKNEAMSQSACLGVNYRIQLLRNKGLVRVGPKSAWWSGQDFTLNTAWIINYDHGIRMESFGEKASWCTIRAQLLNTRSKLRARVSPYPSSLPDGMGLTKAVKVDFHSSTTVPNSGQTGQQEGTHRRDLITASEPGWGFVKGAEKYVVCLWGKSNFSCYIQEENMFFGHSVNCYPK